MSLRQVGLRQVRLRQVGLRQVGLRQVALSGWWVPLQVTKKGKLFLALFILHSILHILFVYEESCYAVVLFYVVTL